MIKCNPVTSWLCSQIQKDKQNPRKQPLNIKKICMKKKNAVKKQRPKHSSWQLFKLFPFIFKDERNIAQHCTKLHMQKIEQEQFHPKWNGHLFNLFTNEIL